MAGELKLFYTSGSDVQEAYPGETRKSIGGRVTSVSVSGEKNSIFGIVSLRMLSSATEEYRCLVLKNISTSAIENLKFYFDVPILAAETDPDDLAPAPGEGDQWIVPPDGEGKWKDKDGKLATFTSGAWVFTFANFNKFALGFVELANVTVGETVFEKSHVTRTENVYEPPPGVEFTEADGLAAIVDVGDGALAAGKSIGVWIKRKTLTFSFVNDDLVANKGGIIVEETIPWKFSYDVI